jgi:hypothetical protein
MEMIKMNNETKNNIKIVLLLFVVFVILYALHITFGDRFEDYYGDSFCHIQSPTIIFMQDNETKTLTVTEIYPKDKNFYWSEISIANGSATLPYGIIKVGDIITNCQGYLELVWGESCIPIYQTDFS